METRADDDEAPTDPAARKLTHHDYTEQDFEGSYSGQEGQNFSEVYQKHV